MQSAEIRCTETLSISVEIMKSWQENILFVDTIIGIMLAIISTSISGFFAGNSNLLIGWLVLCTIVIAIPIVWWIPFVPQKKAQQIALQYALSKNSNVAILNDATLDGWRWQANGYYPMITNRHDAQSFTVIVHSKSGKVIESSVIQKDIR